MVHGVIRARQLITAYWAPFQHTSAETTLEALAALQATETDDFRDADPGRSSTRSAEAGWQERRKCPLGVLGTTCTPLFLILLDEYHRWTGDDEFIRRLEPAARAAIAWIEGPGDPTAMAISNTRRARRRASEPGLEGLGNAIMFDVAGSRPADRDLRESRVSLRCQDPGGTSRRRLLAGYGARQTSSSMTPPASRAIRSRLLARLAGTTALALDREKAAGGRLTSNTGHCSGAGSFRSPGRQRSGTG